MRYVVAGSRDAVRKVFDRELATLPGEWRFVADTSALVAEVRAKPRPRYIFFLHWSSRIDDWLTRDFECIGFHMSELPYGRGGSPLQNLIMRGHAETQLTAFRMTDELDAGPVYMRETLTLDGSAEQILERAYHIAARMAVRIVAERPGPVPQRGIPVVFQRRRAHESEIPELDSLPALYDFVRMLDAEGYPHAFIRFGRFRIEFRNAVLQGSRLHVDAVISDRRDG
jgi:methionyl-tRNA formyltransferase